MSREMAFYIDDAGGKESGFGSEGAVGAGIDIESAAGGNAVEKPEGAVADGKGVREEAGVEWGSWQCI